MWLLGQLRWWLLFALGMSLLPLFISPGTLRIFIFANFLAMFAMSWDILSGRTGYISFGHPFLIGIAGYTTAMLTYHLNWPLYITIPTAVVTTMIGGTLFFLPALRIRGTYFALVTLAFMELMYHSMQVVQPKLTGGTRGLSGLPTLVSGAVPNYYLSFLVMFAIGVGLWFDQDPAGDCAERDQDGRGCGQELRIEYHAPETVCLHGQRDGGWHCRGAVYPLPRLDLTAWHF